jgi:hypothetical protein
MVGILNQTFAALVLAINRWNSIDFYLAVTMSVFGGVEVMPRTGNVSGGMIMPIYLAAFSKGLFSDDFTMNGWPHEWGAMRRLWLIFFDLCFGG